MEWTKRWPGAWACQVRSDLYWQGGIYLYTYVPSKKAKRGNIYYNPKGGRSSPAILGCEVTLAQAKRLAESHDESEREQAEWEAGRPLTRLEQAREYMQAARQAWHEWRNREENSAPNGNPAWREYMRGTAHPLNTAAVDLLIDLHNPLTWDEWPVELQLYVRYVEEYDALIARWMDRSELHVDDTTGQAFPSEVDAYVAQMKDPELPMRKPVKRSRVEMLFDKD